MSNLMNNLFVWDLELILRDIFWCLDVTSLRKCRQVNQTWKDFIDNRIWNCRRYKEILIHRIWSEFVPIEQKLCVRNPVVSIRFLFSLCNPFSTSTISLIVVMKIQLHVGTRMVMWIFSMSLQAHWLTLLLSQMGKELSFQALVFSLEEIF